MTEERRGERGSDRRAHSRSGRRAYDAKKPWYRRRRLWLATASIFFVGWKRVRTLVHREPRQDVGA